MLGKRNKNYGSSGFGKRKFPHKEDYQCDMAEGLFSQENFRNSWDVASLPTVS